MDGSSFSYCLRNKRTSDLSVWTGPQGCSQCLHISENLNPPKPTCASCSRNFMKCKPWRRKSTPKWTWLDTFSWLKLSLLLASFFHVVLQVLSRTIFTKTTSRFRLHWILLIISFLGGIFLPLASCQDSLQPTPSVKGQLPNAVVYVGSAFSYNISESVFDCDVDSIMVSETADRFLSHWLSYNSNKKQLYGVPSDKDKGTYNILVVALTKDAMVRGHVCGSRSFSIVVMPVSEELPVSVHLGTGISSSSYHKSAHSLSCFPGTQAVLGTIILNADIQGLNGHERMTLLLKMANHLNIHSSKVSFFSGEISHPIIQHLDNPAVIAAGVGDGRFAKGSRSLLTWNIGCGAVKLEDVAFSRLETDAQDGTITTLLGFPVVGWHVMSGAQKNMARRRVRRQAVWARNTPTPTMSSAPPSRLSSMSTVVITSRSVTLTSAFSDSSTIRLPTSAVSSVAPNRTVVQSSSVSMNLTVSSQLPNRTVIQSSSVSMNLTVSSQLPNRTVVQSSSVGLNLTLSSRSPNRTVIQSSSVSINVTLSSQSFSRTVIPSSSVTSFQPTSIFSSAMLTPTLTVTSSKAVLSRNISQVVESPTVEISINRTSSSVTTPTLNSTFITRTVATTSIFSSAVISSLSLSTTAMTRNSSIIALQPSESTMTFVSSAPTIPSISASFVVTASLSHVTLIPSTSQVESSAVLRTSSFVVSANRTTLVPSPSLVTSPSLVLTTLQPTSVTISTSKLNSSTPDVTSPTLTRQPTATLTIASSFVTVANTSVPVTSSVNQTSLSTRSKASMSSVRLTSTLSISFSSSLVILVRNTTSVESVASSLVTSSFVTSSLTVLSSTPQLGSTTLLNRTSLTPASTSLVRSVVPTMSSTERSVVKTSSFVPSSLNFSSVMLSSSLIQPSPVSSSSSARVNMTPAVSSFTSATLKPNVTSTFVLPSLTASPLVTSVNLTSVVISVNTSTTQTTAMVNSTSKRDRSSFVTLTTSAFSPSTTSGTRTFSSTFATNRTVVATTSEGVEKSSVNTSSTPKITSTAFMFSSVSSLLSTFKFSSEVQSSNVTMMSKSPVVTVSQITFTASSEVRVNFTAFPSIQGSSSSPSIAVTRLMNSSVSSQTIIFSSNTTQTLISTREVSSTILVVNSTSVVPSASRLFTNSSSLIATILPSSTSTVVSSTSLLPNTSSLLVTASQTSDAFSSAETSIESSASVLNSSRLAPSSTSRLFTDSISPLKSTILLTTAIFTGNRTVIVSTTEVGISRTTPVLSSFSSLVTSRLTSQTMTTVFSTSDGIIKSSEILQNTTTVIGANRTASTSSSPLVSSSSLMSRSSTIAINSTLIEKSSATVTPSFTTVKPTSATVIPTTISSFSRKASPSSVGILVNSTQSTRAVTRTTRAPHSSSRLVSVSSSVQPSVTVTPTSRLTVNRTTSIVESSGPLSSSSALPSSNTTPTTTTATDTTQIIASPTSTVVVIPTTAPPNLPPRLLNNMGRVRAPAGKALHYTIPDDTFYDREDRVTTRNLSLSMSLANGTSIPKDFWMQFDIASQTLNGLPLNAHVPDGIMGEVFVLRARDSRGAEALDAFEVLVVPSEKPVVQELKVRITNEFSVFDRDVAQRLRLLDKIASYYGDADASKIRVLTFTSGSVIMTWTNDSLPTDTCDEEKVQYVANKMLLPNGEVREEFRDALQGFPVISASEERVGVCNGSSPVPTGQPIVTGQEQSKMEEHLWYKHVLVGLVIVLIIIVLFGLLIWCYRRRRPKPSNEKRTFKKRKPIVLGTEIELKPIPGKPLVLPDDDPSFPPSYISETSLDKPMYSDGEDEEDYGKGSPSVVYEPPPPFYPVLADDPRHSPPPAYLMPPMY